ncbi:hypothetical protein D1Z90_17380 [Motilimonas pumila]|uniref:Uncharacterized protein n=1 Tax=Motilimonas pumila TaxID=2303987 RepID=A0A418YAQ0_9GAMM|nr:hypothetical protein D1Z90_17380 [Motilimonas pumila]
MQHIYCKCFFATNKGCLKGVSKCASTIFQLMPFNAAVKFFFCFGALLTFLAEAFFNALLRFRLLLRATVLGYNTRLQQRESGQGVAIICLGRQSLSR